MRYQCQTCGHKFFWSPPCHWGAVCPNCGDRHSIIVES